MPLITLIPECANEVSVVSRRAFKLRPSFKRDRRVPRFRRSERLSRKQRFEMGFIPLSTRVVLLFVCSPFAKRQRRRSAAQHQCESPVVADAEQHGAGNKSLSPIRRSSRRPAEFGPASGQVVLPAVDNHNHSFDYDHRSFNNLKRRFRPTKARISLAGESFGQK